MFRRLFGLFSWGAAPAPKKTPSPLTQLSTARVLQEVEEKKLSSVDGESIVKGLGDENDEYPNNNFADDATATASAIANYQAHVKKSAQLYREHAETWKQLAIDIAATISVEHVSRAHLHSKSVITLIGDSLASLGAVILNLHRLGEFASVNMEHIILDIHKHLLTTHNEFQQKCKELENSADASFEDQQVLKLQVAKCGMAIWDELAEMEENIDSLINECFAYQKVLEKGSNILVVIAKNLALGYLVATLGNFEALKDVKINGICWEEYYNKYLNTALDPGKQRVELKEINLSGELVRAKHLIATIQPKNTQQVAEAPASPNQNKFFKDEPKKAETTPVVENTNSGLSPA